MSNEVGGLSASIPLTETGRRFAARLGELDGVLAIAQGGSAASGLADEHSDIDLYVFSREAIKAETRQNLVLSLAVPGSATVGHDWFGGGDVWRDPESNLLCDVMYWTTEWSEDQVIRTLDRHEPQLGYSTAHVYTIQKCVIHFDPAGWLQRLQNETRRPYPDALARAIIDYNMPMLDGFEFSFRNQLEKSLRRQDMVAAVHVLDRFVASYFDVLFSANKQFHPGEKRLLEHVAHLEVAAPAPADIEALITATASGDPEALRVIDKLIARLRAAL